MTTVSLELSRQLQETFPEWKTELYHVYDPETGGDAEHQILDHEDAISFGMGTVICINPQLEELRVFALELIEDTNAEWEEWERLTNQLKNALIQGCDPTAGFIINTFGGK